MNFHNVPARRLYQLTQDVFLRLGYAPPDATRAANVLHYADLRGHDTHGVANLAPIYCKGVSSGEIHLAAQPRWLRNDGATAALDADGALGLLAAQDGMIAAIAKARDFGIGCVTVSNSSHFGAAGFYSDMALQKRLIGMAMTNLGMDPVASPLCSKRPLLGTNPISFAVGGNPHNIPFSLDMSTTVTASGKIKQALRRNQSVPAGWLVDAEGQSVTQPAHYYDGQAQLPMLGGASVAQGGHKGLGLGLMVEVLCGVLSGAHTSADKGQAGRNSVGHFFLAIDPGFFRASADFTHALDGLLDSINQAETFPGAAPLCHPGVPDERILRERQQNGIPLDDALFAQLNELAEQFGLPPLCTQEAA